MTGADVKKAVRQQILSPAPTDILVHTLLGLAIVISVTILGEHKVLNSGDILAVYTSLITGTATVAGARASNRRTRSIQPLENDE